MEVIPNVDLVSGLRGVNAYLLLGETPTLVDTGMPGSAETILHFAESLGVSAGDLARIVVTHHHLDHVGGLSGLKQRSSAEVWAHPADVPFITGEQAPPPARSAMMRLLFRLLAPLVPGAEPVPVDRTLNDGDKLDVLGGATVVHVPGHTPGSIALHLPAQRLLICGDVISHRRNRLGPPPQGVTADMHQAIASIRRLAGLEFDILCPGHGTPLVGGASDQVRAMLRGLA
jgi:glyoxylase-like metal-dependent hydrolase (beta-lactamase superfamily II)